MDKKLLSDGETAGQAETANHAALTSLFSAQIVAALQDLSRSESEINEFFNHVRHKIDGLVDWIDATEEKSLEMAAAHASLLSIRNAASNSIQYLQSFDRVEQRLQHVIQNIDQVADATSADSCYLIDLVESSYSLEHEHHLITMLRNGASKQELMEVAARQTPQCGESELF